MKLFMDAFMLILFISTAFCFVRVVRGPALPDRVVALDTIGVHFVAIVTIYSIQSEKIVFLDAAIVAALLFFLGTVTFGRYLEQGGKQQ
jgi:multicomponent Na+:H+ antiporter subunit F